MNEALKSTLDRLKNHLRERRESFTEAVSGGNGCPTCGHGASTYHDLDFDQLCAEIDTFGKQLANETSKQQRQKKPHA